MHSDTFDPTNKYTFAATTAAASLMYARPQLARAVTPPSFPPEIALVGEVSNRFTLRQPLTIRLEQDETGQIIASDNIFYMFGQGATRQQALRDYVVSLSEYYDLLATHKSVEGEGLFRFLQGYLQLL